MRSPFIEINVLIESTGKILKKKFLYVFYNFTNVEKKKFCKTISNILNIFYLIISKTSCLFRFSLMPHSDGSVPLSILANTLLFIYKHNLQLDCPIKIQVIDSKPQMVSCDANKIWLRISRYKMRKYTI